MTLKKGGSLLLLTLLLLPSQVHATPPSFDIDLKELDRKPAAAPKMEKKKAHKAKKPAAETGKAAQTPTDTSGYVRYTVKPGDHIFKILVARFGMSNDAAERLIPEIIRINNIPNIKSLTVGRTLLIPAKGAKERVAASTKKVKSQKKRESAVAPEIPEVPAKLDVEAEIDSFRARHPVSSPAAVMRPVEEAPSASAPATVAVPAPPVPAPAVPAPAALAPFAPAPVATAPASAAPAPAAPAPVAPAPVAPAPAMQAPATQAPATQAPATQAPATQAPAAPAPVVLPPVAKAPIAKAPVAKAPVPVTSAPPAPTPVVPVPVPSAHAAHAVSATSKSNEIPSGRSGHPIPSANTWVCSVTDKDSGKMVDAVLNALSIPWSRNRIINSGDGAANTFSIMVDRYFEYRGGRYIVTLGDGDTYGQTLAKLLEGAGCRVLRIGSGEKFEDVGDKLLRLIGVAPDFGKQALQGGVETTGFLVQQDDAGGKRVVITGEHVDPRQKWLMAPGCGGKL